MSQTQTIAITGANGFIGLALAKACLAQGIPVAVLIRKQSEAADKLASLGARVIYGDLDNQDALATLCRDATVVVHCAAFMGKRDPELSHQVNVIGTENVLKAADAHAVSQFVFVSSISVYRGTDTPQRIFDESISPALRADLNHYSRTKIEGEHLVEAFCKSRDLDYTIVRPTNVYGPGCRPWGDDVESLVSRFHICFGRVAFNFIHIDDLIDGFLLIFNSDRSRNETFNLCAEPLELRAFHRHVAKQKSVFVFDVPRPIDALIRHGIDGFGRYSGEIRSTGYTKIFNYPHDKATQILGYQPQRLIESK
ncbi:MAG: hypothetical protein CMH52_13860 [Myxococcales bacterium]|nr:hypothetical protein [Myxococcales bacterium]